MYITLIRHGKTVGNLKRLYYGSTDLPLAEEGLAELCLLRRERVYPKAERFYTSGMLRAEQSLKALYGDVPHEALTGMREIDFGAFEMRTYEDLKNDQRYIEWITGDNEANVCPGGESGVSVTQRALEAISLIISRGEDAVCISHGGVIGGLMGSWFKSTNSRYEFTPEPGMGFRIEFKEGEPVSYIRIPFEAEK